MPPHSVLAHTEDLYWLAAAVAGVGLGAVLAGSGMGWAAAAAGWRRRGMVALAGLALAAAAWSAFTAAMTGFFPHLDASIAVLARLEAFAIAAAGGLAAAGITVGGTRSVRNAALAGSAFAAAVSCMLFTGMSALAAPLPLAYDLGRVLAAMTAGSALAGAGLWQLGRPSRRPAAALAAAALLAAAPLLVAFASLTAILPFNDWQAALDGPETMAFRPLSVVFASELVVALALGLAGAGVDRQAASRVTSENERLRQLSDSTFEALLIHRDGRVLDANGACCALLGLPLAALRGAEVATLLPALQAMPDQLDTAAMPVMEAEIRRHDGEILPVELLARRIAYTGGPANVTALRDISERRIAEQRILYLAHHDTLTGLPNRALLHEVVTRQLAMEQRDGGTAALFCMDLDRFKAVNDTLGHQAGDQLLLQAAQRLQDNIRATDTVARIGGDEFVLLQPGDTQPEAAARLGGRLIDAFAEPFDLDGQLVTVGLSIGIALFPQDGEDAETLARHADIALYRAKAQGRGNFCFFKAGMDDQLRARRALEQELAHAIAANAFELAYQPLFDGRDTGVVGFEALLRWPHPERGMISPADFIPLAEETGLIVPLGTWVLNTACAAAAAWPGQGRVAVNVSPRQFSGGNLPANVATALAQSGLAPNRLELEITESLLIHDNAQALRILNELKAMGVRIVLDDFGTGYSSLSYLQRFPFDKVKIDKSFVAALKDDSGARAIVGAILAMSHQLHLEVTAEGVETTDQLAMLRAQACDQLQGFLLGRPMHGALVADFLADRQAEAAAASLRRSAAGGQATDAEGDREADATMLAAAAQKLGGVVQMIQDPALQAHLLALKSTIEVALSDAGSPSLAAVADEVEGVARRIARATSDLHAEVTAIQAETTAALHASAHVVDAMATTHPNAPRPARRVADQPA